MRNQSKNDTPEMPKTATAPAPLWSGDELIIRAIAVLQLAMSGYILLMTAIAPIHAWAASHETGFDLWIVFWLCGATSGWFLSSRRLWTRIIAFLWNVLLACSLLARIAGAHKPAAGLFRYWVVVALCTSAYCGLTATVALVERWRRRERSQVSAAARAAIAQSWPRVAIALSWCLLPVAIAVIAKLALSSDQFVYLRLNSASEATRCATAAELARKGKETRRFLPKLEQMLENTTCEQFEEDKLLDDLEAIGGIDPFLRVMKSGGQIGRPKAAWRVRYVGRQYPQRYDDIIAAFVDGLTDSDHLVRQASAEGLGTLGLMASKAAPELEQALKDSDRGVRKAAVESLAQVHSLEGLKTAVSNPDEQVRNLAIQRLGGMTPDEIAVSNEMYGDMINDPELSPSGREKLMKLYPPHNPADLKGFGTAGLDSLIRALDDPDEYTSAAAAKGLSNLGRGALPALEALQRAALHAASAQTRGAALGALHAIGHEGLSTIEQAVRDSDETVRDYAIALLPSYGKAGVPALIAVLKEPWNQSSERAVAALDSLGPEALPALAVLEDVATNAPDPTARKLAISALSKIGPQGFSAVEKAVNDPDPSVSAAAELAVKGMRMRYSSH